MSREAGNSSAISAPSDAVCIGLVELADDTNDEDKDDVPHGELGENIFDRFCRSTLQSALLPT